MYLNKQYLFGKIEDGQMILNECGKIANNNLIAIPNHINNVAVDKFIVMPNHIHLILIVLSTPVGTRYIVSETEISPMSSTERTPCMTSLQVKSKQTVPKTVQQFKASVSRQTKNTGLWQPKYHDHIIRNQSEYQKIWEYIDTNPLNWQQDCYYE